MENLLDIRIAEVLDILNHTKREITDLIPKNVMNLLKEKASKDYKVFIDYESKDWIDNLPDETVEIIAIIYRDYIVDPEERKKLIAEEQEEIRKIEEENRQKFSYENLFTKNNSMTDNTDEDKKFNSLIPVSEKIVWYKKVLNFLKNIF